MSQNFAHVFVFIIKFLISSRGFWSETKPPETGDMLTFENQILSISDLFSATSDRFRRRAFRNGIEI